MLQTRIYLKLTIRTSHVASTEEPSKQTVDYFSIYTFADVEIVICSNLLPNQKLGTTIVMNDHDEGHSDGDQEKL